MTFTRTIRAILLAAVVATGNAFAEPVTTIAAARELSFAAFDGRRDFSFKGQVVAKGEETCVLFDATGGASLEVATNLLGQIMTGEVCRISGVLSLDAERDRHFIVRSVERIGSRPLPPVVDLSAAEIHAERNFHRKVRVRGVIESFFRDELDPRYCWLVVRTSSGILTASASEDVFSNAELASLVDAEVEICAHLTPYSSLRRHFGAHLSLTSASDLRVCKPSRADPFTALPYRATDELHRQCVIGRVRAVSATRFFVDAGEWDPCLEVRLSPSQQPPAVGHSVAIVGFTQCGPSALRFVHAVWRDKGISSADEPCATEADIDALFRDAKGRNQMDASRHGRLLRLTGIVRVRAGDALQWNLVSNRHAVRVDLSAVPGATSLEENARAEITGLCVADPLEDGAATDFRRFEGFTLIPRRAQDVRVLSCPPWWTVRRLLVALVVLCLLLVGLAVWIRLLQRLVEQRGRELAAGDVARAEAEMRTLERTRCAAELHDSVAQNLALASYEIDSAVRRAGVADDVLAHLLKIAGRTVKACNRDLRNCLWDLRNDALEVDDLAEAIRRSLVPHVRGVKTVIRVGVPRARLTDTTAHALFCIIRELVINSISHGHATEVWIAGSVEESSLLFSVRDNGSGFDPAHRAGVEDGHFGLTGVAERVRRLGGSMTIKSVLGRGTRVAVRLALSSVRENATEERS